MGLWLIGLGVEVIWNPPARPQKNGVVERAQGTTYRWAEPGRCGSVAELQEHLDQVVRFQREVYPAVKGKNRQVCGFWA